MENRNLYQDLKLAKKDKRILDAKYAEKELAMQKEIAEAIRPIKEKYEPILKAFEKERSEKYHEIWHIAGIYHDYASFFACDIVDIVAVFLTYIEGEKYIPYRDWNNYEITENSIIIKEEVYKQYDKINYKTLDMLYKNGDLIRLDEGFCNMVNFYNNFGEPNYSFGQFNYLHEFINRLIQYRIDNDKKYARDITMEELYSFMCNFISTHPDLAMRNKNKREQMFITQDEDETIISQCKNVEKMLKK